MKLVVFDCDGTLVDGQHGIHASMAGAFERHGLPAPSRSGVRRIIGLSLIHAIERLLPEDRKEEAVMIAESYKDCFHAIRDAGGLDEPLYPGIRAMIERLSGQNVLLGVATGKGMRGLRLTLDHHGLKEHFITLQTADTHPSKPNPQMLFAALREAGVDAGSALMVGDTHFDMEMAVSAGCVPIGVDWGYHDPEDLLKSGAREVITNPEQIFDLLRAL